MRVSDDGIGIAPDTLPSIFERFAGDPGSRGASGGLGIGLSLARDLVNCTGAVGGKKRPTRTGK